MPLLPGVRGPHRPLPRFRECGRARSPLPHRSSLNMQKDVWKSKKDDRGPSFLISVL